MIPAALRARLAGVTGRQVIVGLLLVLLLVALPVGATLARGDHFESRVEVVKVHGAPEVNRLIPPDLEAFASRLSAREHVTETASKRVGYSIDPSTVAARTRVEAGNGLESAVIVASESSPERASKLAQVVAGLVANEPTRDVAQGLRRKLRRLLDRLGEPGVSASESAFLEDLAVHTGAVVKAVVSRPAMRARATSDPEVTGTVDKLLDGLPGELPARPSPAAVGLAGLLLVGAIVISWLIFGRAWTGRVAGGRP